MNIAVLCSNSADTHIWGDLNAHTACSCQLDLFFFLTVFVVLDSLFILKANERNMKPIKLTLEVIGSYSPHCKSLVSNF